MIKSGKSPFNEAVVTVVLDEDKLEKAMKKHGYDSDAYFEFLYDIYGIEDGEDFQAGNTGLDLMFYSEDSKVKKLRKELGESVQYHSHSATESINESTYDGDTVNWNKISAGDVVGWTIEGMGKLPKVGDDFRVGPFIGKCTKVSGSKVYMKIESDSRELNESVSHPKLGKKVKQLKGWKIYQGTNSTGEVVFRCFTPDEYRPEVGYEDWECDTLEQAIEWIQNY